MADITHVLSWTLTESTVEADAKGTSGSAGQTLRTAGRRDATATVEGLYSPSVGIVVSPGTEGVLSLYSTSGTNDFWAMTAMCTGVNISGDTNSGSDVRITYNFGMSYDAGDTALAWTGAGTAVYSSTAGHVDWT